MFQTKQSSFSLNLCGVAFLGNLVYCWNPWHFCIKQNLTTTQIICPMWICSKTLEIPLRYGYLFSAQSCRMFLAFLTPQHHHGFLFPLPTTIILLSSQRQCKLYTPTSPPFLKLSVCVVCFSLRKRTFKIIFSRETDCTQLRVSEFFISPVYLTIAKPLLSARQYTGRSFGPWVL